MEEVKLASTARAEAHPKRVFIFIFFSFCFVFPGWRQQYLHGRENFYRMAFDIFAWFLIVTPITRSKGSCKREMLHGCYCCMGCRQSATAHGSISGAS